MSIVNKTVVPEPLANHEDLYHNAIDTEAVQAFTSSGRSRNKSVPIPLTRTRVIVDLS